MNRCFDAGHAHMAEGVANAFDMMKGRITSTHIHDDDGKDDQHLYPQAGMTCWREAMTLLRSQPDQCPLMLEERER